MKKIIILSSIIVILFLSGCAQQGNNNPAGVIGGPGNFGDPGGAGGSIVGAWLYEEIDEDRELWKSQIYFIFDGDGTFIYERFEMYWDEYDEEWVVDYWYSENGVYSVSGNQLTVLYEDGYAYTGAYAIYGNELWLYNSDGSYVIFERVYRGRNVNEANAEPIKVRKKISNKSDFFR